MSKRFWQYLPFVALLVVIFMKYANTVDDLDFWWHLKHGQLIINQHHLPTQDPFAVSSEISAKVNQRLADSFSDSFPLDQEKSGYSSMFLKLSWLFQACLYLIYRMAGFVGVGVFKSLVFVISYILVYLLMLRRGATHSAACLVLAFIALIGSDFNYTRAQITSFLMFPAVLIILDKYARQRRIVVLLPLAMVLWANLHGGFILGEAVITIWLLCEALKYIFMRVGKIPPHMAMNGKEIVIFMSGSVLGMFAGLLNPAGYRPLLFPFISAGSSIEEFLRPMLYEYHAYWLMLILVVISLVVLLIKKQARLNELFLGLFLLYWSSTAIRYIIFFALGTGTTLAYALTLFFQWIIATTRIKLLMQTLMRPIPDNFKATLYSITVAVLILCSLFVGPSLIFDMRQSRYPSQAVNFVKEHKIDGIVFNPYDWGGYLVWSLAPENTVFIDGRGINETAKRHAGIILLADKGKDAANPLWKRLLNAYNIHCIIISAVAKNGYVYPLIDEISRDNDWELVFAKDRSLVFLDNVKANQYIILNNKVPKDELINAIVRECELGIQETPATWGYYETLGLAYIKLNRFADARKMFATYLSMNPYNENIRNYYNLLSQYQRQE